MIQGIRSSLSRTSPMLYEFGIKFIAKSVDHDSLLSSINTCNYYYCYYMYNQAWMHNYIVQNPHSIIQNGSPANSTTPWPCSLVPRPHHAREERVWWHWRRFLVLQAQQSCDYLHRFVLAYVRSRDGAQDQENAPMSPDPWEWGRVYVTHSYMSQDPTC